MRLYNQVKLSLTTMQAIQLHATPNPDFRLPETVELQMTGFLQDSGADLDDALAVVLNAIRQSQNPQAMEALGTLLGYMETLERKQLASQSTENWLTLANPLTMSL